MENMEIASVLREFGDLLEIKGSNPFRIRAYRNAVRTINDLTRPLAAMVAISTDAHSVQDLGLMSYGVDQAQRGWLEPVDVLNALSLEDFQLWRKRK